MHGTRSGQALKRPHRADRDREKRRAKGAAANRVEREIKLQVPDHSWEGLLKEMSGPDAQAQDLHAIYYDTTAGALGQAKVALRLRREGRQWVQTLKAPGPHALERVEDEVVVGPALEGQTPSIDLERHRSVQSRDALRAALRVREGDPFPALQPVFEVKVRRWIRRVVQGRSVIELALDDGQLLAGGRARSVRELEIELERGNASDLLALAARWRRRWRLWISTPSKAARAQRLASGELYAPPTSAAPPKVPGKPDLGMLTAAVLDACLEQVLANASEVAAGSHGDDHVHQLRVGLRRLRTAMRELPDLQEVARRHGPTLVEVFRQLGERRDRTHVLRKIQPLVEAAGGAPLRVPPGFHEGPDPSALVRGDAFQEALMGLLARSEQLRTGGGKGGVRRTLRAHLSKLHGQVTREGRRFTRLTQDDQHRVRKRLKRLRYLSEFAAPLFASSPVQRYLAQLKPAQDALGQYNDEIMAQGLYEELVGSDAGARFGAQWLQKRRGGEARACRRTLRAMEDAEPFWKKS